MDVYLIAVLIGSVAGIATILYTIVFFIDRIRNRNVVPQVAESASVKGDEGAEASNRRRTSQLLAPVGIYLAFFFSCFVIVAGTYLRFCGTAGNSVLVSIWFVLLAVQFYPFFMAVYCALRLIRHLLEIEGVAYFYFVAAMVVGLTTYSAIGKVTDGCDCPDCSRELFTYLQKMSILIGASLAALHLGLKHARLARGSPR